MNEKTSLPPDYFERIFAGDPDPWEFETSAYEATKFNVGIDALGRRRFKRALEVGCAGGMLTKRLAPHCNAIVALDVSDTALDRARKRNVDAHHVQFAKSVFPREAPDGSFDLIVLSEVVYYWDHTDIAAAGAWIAAHLDIGGDLLLVHWIGDTDYPQTGDEAVRLLRAALPDVSSIRAERTDKYRLDLWRVV